MAGGRLGFASLFSVSAMSLTGSQREGDALAAGAVTVAVISSAVNGDCALADGVSDTGNGGAASQK